LATGTVTLHQDENFDVEQLKIGGTAVTATAAELNALDGITSTVAELNKLDGVTASTAELNILDGVTATAAELNKADGIAATAYHTVTEGISFTEDGSTTLTGTVEIPAGAILNDIQVVITVLFDDSGAVTMIVGDDDDDNGWFTGVNMKATDLVVGEVLSAADVDKWGGKEGVYLTSAGRMGRTTAGVDSGPYYGAASEVIGVITTANQDGTAGRAFMFVTYSVPTVVAATGA
jgi:hypothetical protein